jgi:spore coat polysaccharide biosynthesis protein SpsF (cytidylyltransferase family)
MGGKWSYDSLVRIASESSSQCMMINTKISESLSNIVVADTQDGPDNELFTHCLVSYAVAIIRNMASPMLPIVCAQCETPKRATVNAYLPQPIRY